MPDSFTYGFHCREIFLENIHHFIIDLGTIGQKKSRKASPRQLIIYYLAGVRYPEKQNPPSSRRRQKVAEGKTRSTSLPSRKKSGDVVAIPSASPRIPRARARARIPIHVHVYAHIRIRVYTHSCPHAVGCKLVLKNLEVN